MNTIKLFEDFVNERRSKSNPTEFTDEVINVISQIEEDADYAEMSDGNIAYFLGEAWKVVMEQINFHDQYDALYDAFNKANVKVDSKFHGVNMKKDAIEFANMAYGLTDYSHSGAVECFMASIKEFMSLSNSQVRSIESYLNDATNESVKLNEKLSKSELNKISDYLMGLDGPDLMEIANSLLIDDEEFQEDKHDLALDEIIEYIIDYANDMNVKLRDIKGIIESVVNEAKINVKKEVKRLKSMGYDAEVWGDGISVDGVDAPNSNYNGKVIMSWDPEDGIYSDDDRYSGSDHSYDKFLDILENPEWTEGEWD
jgi:hypothetical protein